MLKTTFIGLDVQLIVRDDTMGSQASRLSDARF